MTWTRFMDMDSGGGLKEKFSRCYIEAPLEEAKLVFYHRFGHSPDRVSCTCCGADYSIDSEETLEQVTAYDRGCDYAYFRPDGTECPEDEGWKRGKGSPKGYTGRYVERHCGQSYRPYQTLKEHLKTGVKDIGRDRHLKPMVIYAKDIKPEERKGELPEEGYVWR